MGWIRRVIPGFDRRGPERFRDPAVASAVETSRATLETNRQLMRELSALQLVIGRSNVSRRKRAPSR